MLLLKELEEFEFSFSSFWYARSSNDKFLLIVFGLASMYPLLVDSLKKGSWQYYKVKFSTSKYAMNKYKIITTI